MSSKGAMILLVVFSGLFSTPLALATTWYVNGKTGSNHNDCKSPQQACKTIAHAISLASSGDSVMVAPAIYKENLTISIRLKLIGSGARTTIIDGGRASTVVYITNGNANVAIAKATIRNGYATEGGGIWSSGALAISDSIIIGNVAGGATDVYGGGIYNNYGTLTVNNSTFRKNIARGGYPGFGGAIYSYGGSLTINDSSFSRNVGEGIGGGIVIVYGTAAISNSTFNGNIGGDGGAIANSSTLTINNSTISGNSVGQYCIGGGIFNSSTVMINNSTISGNSAPAGNGGGIAEWNGGVVTLQNSIVANSPSGGNCYGSSASKGYNLSSDNTCNFSGPGDKNNTNPKLGKFANHGGPTKTYPLLEGSPAIDAGNPKGCTDGHGHLLKTDQRGYPRPDKEDKTGCDVGAYERQTD